MTNGTTKIGSEEVLLPIYGILVATKNRPRQLSKFLKSVSTLSLLPLEVVIVSSGIDITEIIEKYSNKLNIKHVHSLRSGQIVQKKLGLKYFSKNLNWIAFFDDDIILLPDSIENVFADVSRLSEKNIIAGIGLACTPSNASDQKFHSRMMKKLFLSSDKNLGQVNKSGYNASYMDSCEVIETQWLNGASIWKAELAKKYNVPFDQIHHAIGEDLFFSYQNLKYGKLFFSPSSKFVFQKYPENHFELTSFVLYTYVQLFFVSTNKDLSIMAFYWRFLGSTIYAIINSDSGTLKFFTDVFIVFKLFLDVTSLVITKKDPTYILNFRINK
jgi:glycosyltransferase involved in cell wall biosynthesis